MTIEQLQYFQAVSIYKTFSNAAVEMNITQSALSKQIAKLEDELGVHLFDRSHRQVALTSQGQQLLKDVEMILNDYHHMMNHLHQLKSHQNKTLRIAMLPIFAQYGLSRKMKTFSQKHPDIHLVIDEIEERDIHQLLQSNHYDVFILRGYHEELASFKRLTLYKDSLVCVISKEHPLSHKKTIDLTDLKNENLLLPPQYTQITKLALQAFQKENMVPHVIRYSRNETLLSQADENEGIAIMMKKTLHVFHLPHVKIIPFTNDIAGDVYLYYSSHHEILKTFIQDIQPVQYK